MRKSATGVIIKSGKTLEETRTTAGRPIQPAGWATA